MHSNGCSGLAVSGSFQTDTQPTGMLQPDFFTTFYLTTSDLTALHIGRFRARIDTSFSFLARCPHSRFTALILQQDKAAARAIVAARPKPYD
jgi:hypothetical protein